MDPNKSNIAAASSWDTETSTNFSLPPSYPFSKLKRALAEPANNFLFTSKQRHFTDWLKANNFALSQFLLVPWIFLFGHPTVT